MCILCFVAAYFFMGGFVSTFFKTFNWVKLIFWPIVWVSCFGFYCAVAVQKLLLRIWKKHLEKDIPYEINLEVGEKEDKENAGI